VSVDESDASDRTLFFDEAFSASAVKALPPYTGSLALPCAFPPSRPAFLLQQRGSQHGRARRPWRVTEEDDLFLPSLSGRQSALPPRAAGAAKKKGISAIKMKKHLEGKHTQEYECALICVCSRKSARG